MNPSISSAFIFILTLPLECRQWTQDARIVYWDKYGHSSYDSPPEYGTWTQVGPRYNLGQYPSAADGPPVPTSGRSGPGK